MAKRQYNLTPNQQTLIDLLIVGVPGRDLLWKRDKFQFVLEYGWWYEPLPLPKGIRRGRPSACFKNAFNLALDDESLTYCEGFALIPGGKLLHHAWATDGTGRVIDSTWELPAMAYAGVPFNTHFVNLYHLERHAIVSLLDDYLHDWPMLRELGDRPKEWLEKKGRGVAPVRPKSGKPSRR